MCSLWPFVMPEASKSLLASTNHDILKPDYFGYYTREIMELLSQDEDFLPFASRTSEFTKRDYGGVRSMDTSKDSFNGIFSSFSNSIGAELSDIKKERLKSLLRQGVFDLTPEVDEVCKAFCFYTHDNSLTLEVFGSCSSYVSLYYVSYALCSWVTIIYLLYST